MDFTKLGLVLRERSGNGLDLFLEGVNAAIDLPDLTNACADIIPTRTDLCSASLDLSFASPDRVVDREK